MAEIGLLIGVIVGVIVVMVLLNKLLDFLSARFYLVYRLVLIGIAVGLYCLVLSLPVGREASQSTFMGYIALSVLYFYMCFVNVDPESYTTTETEFSYNDWTDTVTATDREVDHYTPAWWAKLVSVAIATAVAGVCTFVFYISWLPLIAEIVLPGWGILLWIKSRFGR